MYLAVVDLRLSNYVIMNATLFTNMMFIDRLMSVYLSFISGGISTLLTMAAGNVLLVYCPLGILSCGQRYIQMS